MSFSHSKFNTKYSFHILAIHSSSQQQGHVHERCHKKNLCSLYIIMKLANNAMLGCMFVTYTDIYINYYVYSAS